MCLLLKSGGSFSADPQSGMYPFFVRSAATEWITSLRTAAMRAFRVALAVQVAVLRAAAVVDRFARDPRVRIAHVEREQVCGLPEPTLQLDVVQIRSASRAGAIGSYDVV